jgi:hypothetical protein
VEEADVVAKFSQSNEQSNDNKLFIDQKLKLARLKFYERVNREAELERIDHALDEHDRQRWGYPPLRSRRWKKGRR